MQRIDNDGVYDLPIEVYHSQCCAGPSISSSGLRKILLESPADYWAHSDLNPARLEAEETDAFVFGRAAHALLLEDGEFERRFAVVPSNAPQKPTAAQRRAREAGRVSDSAAERFAFWDAFEALHEGKDFISEDDLETVMRIAETMRADPVVTTLLTGEPEKSIIWKDRTGVWLKSRIDVLSETGDLADLKTTTRRNLPLLFRDIRSHGYDMQMGLATMALENVMDVPFTADAYEGRACVLCFVAKKPPHHVMPVEIDFDALHWARIKCRKAIDTFAKCLETGEWPGPVQGIPTYSVSEAERLEIEKKQETGEWPTIA